MGRLVLFILGSIGLAIGIAMFAHAIMQTFRPDEPTVTDQAVPVIADVPAFTLTSHEEQPVGRDELAGKVWVANFIFTRCRGICPAVTSRMNELQRMLRTHPQWEDVRLVSFSVDPTHDTPAVLREYGRKFDADPEQWVFLTGEREPMWQLVEGGFKLAVEEMPEDDEMPIMHSDKFVLVDRQNRIRGYYSSMDQADRAQLLADVQQVLAE